ncbi:MAG TPA: tetratricopeptide repeat protein [Capsulimonadaceae bacterium]|nr:tetratricopeptide repeat protein [Capsulimonadaceae bacterium]
MLRRILLLSLLLAAALFVTPWAVSADGSHKPPPIPVVLYLESQGPAEEPAQPLLDLRNRLRAMDRLEVLVFEADSPTFILAARNASPPIDLGTVNNFDTRLALAHAVDAQFALMAAPTNVGSDRIDLKLFEVAPISRSWSFSNEKVKDALKAISAQIVSAASEKPPATSPASPAKVAPVPLPPPSGATIKPSPVQSVPIGTGTNPTPPPPSGAASPMPVQPPAAQAPTPFVTVIPPKPSAPESTPANLPAPAKPAPIPEPIATQAAPPASAPKAQPQSKPAKPSLPLAAPAVANPVTPKPQPAPPPVTTPPTPTSSQANARQKQVNEAVLPPLPPAPNPSSASSSKPKTASGASAGTAPANSGKPQPAGAGEETPLATESPVAAPPPGPALNDAAIGKMANGDTALQQSDIYGAIQFYREAVNEAPRATEPRMRLIKAYIQAGLKDQALDEERRALMIDPNNADVQNLLKSQTADGSLPGADLAVRQAAVSRDPSDETAWIALGDSYWNSGQPDQALAAYEKAARLKPGDVAAQAHLARLYAATSQYEKSLDALTKAGPDGYPYALRIIAARTDSLVADIESAHDDFIKGTSTREQFYDALKRADTQSEALAQFVGKIAPPSEYKVAYLHRRLATNLLAQATAEWLSFVETNDDQHSQQATLLQSEAAEEMKTASIAERLQSSLSAVSH